MSEKNQLYFGDNLDVLGVSGAPYVISDRKEIEG